MVKHWCGAGAEPATEDFTYRAQMGHKYRLAPGAHPLSAAYKLARFLYDKATSDRPLYRCTSCGTYFRKKRS